MSKVDQTQAHTQQMHWNKRAMEAEKEAQNKIQESRNKIRQTEIEEQKQIDQIKDQYQKIRLNEQERSTNQLIEFRNKHSAQLQDTKRAHSKQMLTEQNQFKDSFMMKRAENLDQLNKEEMMGKNALIDTQMMYQDLIESEARKGNFQLQNLEKENQEQITRLRSEQEEQKTLLTQQNNQQLEAHKTNNQTLFEQNNKSFIEKFELNKDRQNSAIGRVNLDAQKQLDGLKSEYSEKLTAYSSQKTDPFYKIKDLNAKIHETEHGFMIKAHVPPHEQDHINITVRNNESIILSGKRRSDESLTTEDGIKKTTHSYQSFSQVFPLNFPVEQRLISRRVDGDQLSIFIPKKMGLQQTPPFQMAKKPSSIQAYQKPAFPESLNQLSKKV